MRDELGTNKKWSGKGQEEKEVDIRWRSESSLQKDHLEMILNVKMSHHLMRLIFDSNVIMKEVDRFSDASHSGPMTLLQPEISGARLRLCT